jgi:hypothetical protein
LISYENFNFFEIFEICIFLKILNFNFLNFALKIKHYDTYHRGCDSLFSLECCLYVEARDREQLTNNLQFLDSLLIETLLFGDDSLSEEQNAQIFKSVQLNIKQTKGFIPQ